MVSPHPAQNSLIYEMLSYELKRYLLDVPYTSISQFYRFFKQENMDETFGVSCVWQTYGLGTRLREKGIDNIRYLYDGRHVVLICEAEGEAYLFDPYLLHTSPIFLGTECDMAKSATMQCESFAYPYRKSSQQGYRPSKLQVTNTQGGDHYRLTYKRFSPTRGHYVASRVFNLSNDKKAPETPPSTDMVIPLLHHGEQNNLSIRVVHSKEHQTYELIYPIALYHKKPIIAENLILKDNNGHVIPWSDTAHKNHCLKKIAETLNVAALDLVDFVLGGVAIYEETAPCDIEYAKYTIGDE